jgi:hypothetical protein
MSKDRREPIGDGLGFVESFSEAAMSRSTPGRSEPLASPRKVAASASQHSHEHNVREQNSAAPKGRDLENSSYKRARPVRNSNPEAHRPSPSLHPDFRPPAPEPGTRDIAIDDDQPVRPLSRDVWVTKDGRELTIKEMYRPHLGNAQAVLSVWLKREKDPVKRRELKSWRSKMRRELVKREKVWQAKRKKQSNDKPGNA